MAAAASLLLPAGAQGFDGGLDLVQTFPDVSLTAPVDVVYSPDGKHAYVASARDDSVTVFAVSGDDLTQRQEVRDGAGGVESLDGAAGLAISPDGRYVYVLAGLDRTLTTLARDPQSGALTPRDVERHDEGHTGDLWGADTLVVSPDGRNVYVASTAYFPMGVSSYGTLSVFSKTPEGGLTFTQGVTDEHDGVDGIGGVIGVDVSADGRNVYVAAREDESVATFSRNAETGRVALLQVLRDGVDDVAGLEEAQHVAVSPDDGHVYVSGHHTLAGFARDPEDGRLSQIQSEEGGGVGNYDLWNIQDLEMSGDGRNLYISGGADQVLTYGRNPLTGRFGYLGQYGHPGYENSSLLGISGLSDSPDGQRLLGAAWEGNAVSMFRRAPGDGQLSFAGQTPSRVMRRALEVTVSPDGKYVYAYEGERDTIAVLERDSRTGRVTHVMTTDPVDNVDGVDTPSIVVSPDGRHVYVKAVFTVTAFTRDPTSGRLALIQQIKPAEQFGHLFIDSLGEGFVISPDGRHVYLAIGGAAAVFPRDAATGLLGTPFATSGGWADDLAMSPDGAHVYSVSWSQERLTALLRDPLSGELEEIHHFAGGEMGDTPGLHRPQALMVSPDGTDVYLTNSEESIGVFGRSTDGGLSPEPPEPMPEDCGSGSGLAMPPDADHVYVTGCGGIVTFDRDGGTGALQIRERIVDGGPVEGLNGAGNLASSPDNANIYAASSEDDVLAVLRRRGAPVPGGNQPPPDDNEPPVGLRAPETKLVSHPPARTMLRRPVFRFRADQLNVRFECRLGGARWTACRSPRRLGPLRPGRHRFSVRAVSRQTGKRDPRPAAWTFRVLRRGRR